MRKLPVLALTGALAASLTAATALPLQAAPTFVVPSLNSMSGTAHVEEVQYRRGGHHHRHHRHGWRGRDALIGLGIGALAGGYIASQSYGYGAPYYDGPYAYGTPVYGGSAYASSSSGWERCEAEFRSLQPDGTYTTYGGEQKLCPYLR